MSGLRAASFPADPQDVRLVEAAALNKTGVVAIARARCSGEAQRFGTGQLRFVLSSKELQECPAPEMQG